MYYKASSPYPGYIFLIFGNIYLGSFILLLSGLMVTQLSKSTQGFPTEVSALIYVRGDVGSASPVQTWISLYVAERDLKKSFSCKTVI